MRGRLHGAAGVAFVSLAVVVLAWAPFALAASNPFPRPSLLEPNVSFWRDIFARYSRNETVIHDDTDLGRVYTVLDFRSWASGNGRLDAKHERMRKDRVREVRKHYVSILRKLHLRGGSPKGLSSEEARVRALFAGVKDPNKYQVAAERVRGQSGLKESFRSGIARMKGYEPAMVEIFRAKGVPPELTRMSLVESTFDLDAYSRVGAAGVWQFMPRTGRQYLRINAAVDERRDPLRASWAAAEHLRRDRKALGAWPLAITAYNHGRGGIARAVKTVGSEDMGEIARRYKGKNFGFASRNFYAEFLAAIDVTANEKKYFGGPIPPLPAPRSREIKLRKNMTVHQAARHVGVSSETLIAMNPAFLSRVLGGRSSIPRGYRLRVPHLPEDGQLALAQADARRVASGKPRYVYHEVRRGQTLGNIAHKYGTTVATLQRVNGIRRPRSLRAGQTLKIPST
ncbi:MAG: transglycosylase SLT domain-containing protein [Candidatus Binatia bacterium]|nr:transglycosylase SLT domain-containing protein [Candidatus Binatia bacterium]